MDKVTNEMKHKKIIVDSLINRYLKIFGAICIEEPKWCGKTWTSSHHAKSEFLVEDPNGNFSNWLFAEIEPYTILEGESPRLIGAVIELDGGIAPLIKCVIYGVGNIAYQNDKAIYILPITALED